MQADTWSSRIERDARGLELHRTFSSGLKTSWQRDVLGRPISQRISISRSLGVGALALRQRRYEWQGADQLRILEDDLLGETQFAYNSLDNLSGAQYANGPANLWQVDTVGTLFRNDERIDRTYGKGGQLRAANGTRYKYDDEGNLIRKTLPDGKAWHYTWDGAGQLLQVKRPDGYAVTFAYDALGRRVSKRFRSRVTKWVWDGDKPLHEWTELEVGAGRDSAADVVTWLFDEENFAPAAKLTASGHYSVVTDYLGTPLELYDAQGRKTWQAQLDSYGAVRAGLGKPQDCPFRYQGQYEDVETGLYYNRFRYYDPEAGLYISQDPIQLEGGLGFYSYVSNTTAYIDPFGLSSCQPQRPGGHQTGDVSNHGTLSPGKNRATGHTNTRVDDFVQSHHPIQNEWAKRNIANYDEYDAPATLLKSSSGSPHAKISALQRARRRLLDGWKGSLKDEFNTSYKEMLDAGVPKAQAQKALQKSYKYFDSIGAF